MGGENGCCEAKLSRLVPNVMTMPITCLFIGCFTSFTGTSEIFVLFEKSPSCSLILNFAGESGCRE